MWQGVAINAAMAVRAASVWQLALLATWTSLGVSQLTTPTAVDLYKDELKQLLQQLMWKAQVARCLAIVTDDLHATLYDGAFFEAVPQHPLAFYMVRVNDSEDLSKPPSQMLHVLHGSKSSGCDLHVITLLNGLQAQQLIKFVYNNRALHMQHKFVLLHDGRLYDPEMLHVWSVFVSALFLRRRQDQHNSFSISTIAYPGILSGVLVLQQLGSWRPGKRLNRQLLFRDKTRDLNGAPLAVATAEHVPMVHLNRSTNTFEGVEVMIMDAMAKTLHFQPLYYSRNESDAVAWDQLLEENETRLETGLIGEVAQHNARFGIGDLHLFQSYMPHVELSLQHGVECLTFLTPESSSDNSWQTFILPFSGGMWTGVMLSLFVVGTVFYLISFLNAVLLDSHQASTFFHCLRRSEGRSREPRDWRRLSLRLQLGRYRGMGVGGTGRDLFDDYANCILLTYSMLLYVALPRMPHHWPLRVLTGWYWIYCILLVATYRASFTAILANPAARVTIDTLQDLNRARIPPATGAIVNKQFFLDASDETAREVGARMEIVEPIDDLTERIARGRCAYYDNEFYLRHLRVASEARGMGSTAVHIMKECVVHMPVVLALEKNSALKPHVDDIIQRLSESGFIAKWLRDMIKRLPAEEQAPQEALMNLTKFWSSFVALGIGYFVSICAILLEHWHFRYIVMQHPLYDVYNPSIYYNFKRLYPNE